MLNPFIVEKALKEAFIEDNHYMDLTTDILFCSDQLAQGQMISKADGILAGVEVATQAFLLLDPNAKIEWMFKDGDSVRHGDLIMQIKAKAHALLKAERIALNFLQRMSGIATMTHDYVKVLQPYSVKLVDTRKTTPLFRPFEKYSVYLGGGANHRYNLSDAVMIKDNHIAVSGGIQAAVELVRKKLGHTVKIEVEVENLDQLKQALDAGADIIMLDNMSIDRIKEAVRITSNRAILEVSGNITLERLHEIGPTGVHVISSGALTHSYSSFDISFKMAL
jgi:nicotinate-nucleotide pyrophosphorylase (carboxylating)